MFYKVIKTKSPTGFMRTAEDPNLRLQDGLECRILCERCEELFSKYEKYFSDSIYQQTISKEGNVKFDSNNDKIAYFLLSLTWRTNIYIMDKDKITFTYSEKALLNCIQESWRGLLDTENMCEIRKIQQFIIPTKELILFKNMDRRIWDNVVLDLKTYDHYDEFKFAFTFIQVPYYIFISTIWGNTNSMKQYKLKKIIKPHKSNLPKDVTTLLYDKHLTQYLSAYQRLTEKQRNKI